jgi:hypothetical protein
MAPGERCARSARSGDTIEGIGPRGKITTSATAGWHPFIGGESAVMAEAGRWGAPPSDDTGAARASRAARRRRAGYVGGLHDGTASRAPRGCTCLRDLDQLIWRQVNRRRIDGRRAVPAAPQEARWPGTGGQPVSGAFPQVALEVHIRRYPPAIIPGKGDICGAPHEHLPWPPPQWQPAGFARSTTGTEPPDLHDATNRSRGRRRRSERRFRYAQLTSLTGRLRG